MSEPVSARPELLRRYPSETGDLLGRLRARAAVLRDALERVRRGCLEPPIPMAPLGDELAGAVMLLEDLHAFVARVADAFAAAGTAGADGVIRTSDDRIAVGPVEWTPIGQVYEDTYQRWYDAVWRGKDRCNSSFGYLGHNGFIIGPDGRRYPLVAPFVERDGVRYQADGTNHVGPSVLDLAGNDPGWRTVEVRSGVERHREEPSVFERVMVGVGTGVAGYEPRSRLGDVQRVTLRPGEEPTFQEQPVARPGGPDPIALDNTPVPGVAPNLVLLAPAAGDLVVGALSADEGAHDAYQVVFQENDDGRVRALYTRVDVTPPDAKRPWWELTGSYVTGDDINADRTIIRYDSGPILTSPDVRVTRPSG